MRCDSRPMDALPAAMDEGLLQRELPWAAEFHHLRGRGRVALAAFAIGAFFGAGASSTAGALSTAGAPCSASLPLPFAVYMMLLASFHLGEYLLTAAFRSDTLSFDSFLLNHSLAYQAMIGVCWMEYWSEYWGMEGAISLWPRWKEWGILSWFGLFLCVGGLALRFSAMVTASHNFSPPPLTRPVYPPPRPLTPHLQPPSPTPISNPPSLNPHL